MTTFMWWMVGIIVFLLILFAFAAAKAGQASDEYMKAWMKSRHEEDEL